MFDFNAKPLQETFKAYGSITSVADIIEIQLPAYSSRPAIRFDKGDGYDSLDFDNYLDHLKAMIQFFTDNGIEQKVIATFCKNRIEWDMVGMAAFYRANALYPLDTKTNQIELEHLLKLNPPDYMLVSRAQLSRIRDLITRLELKTRLIIADLVNVFEDISFEQVSCGDSDISVTAIHSDYEHTRAIEKSPLLDNTDTILGHYPTSGTTNLPKVVTISHGNIVAEVNEAIDVINLRHNEDLLNIGPYTHIATLVEFLVTKTRGFCVTYFTREPDDDDVLEDEIKKLKSSGVRIKALMAVPKFWIYLMKEVLEEMKNKPVLHGLYKHLISIEKSDKLYDIGTLDKAKLATMRILLRNKLGGYFSYGISSSMKLDGAIVEILGKLGVTVIDIYGATECSGIISRNRLNDINPGSCGRIIEPLQHRLTDQHIVPGIEKPVGLMEVKGRTVSPGYLGGQTADILTADGFYPTGDLCWLDESGWLHIVGREKELTRWHDGTYIDPQYLSNLMVRSIFIKDAMVIQADKDDDFLSVYVFPDEKRLRKDPEWQKQIDTGVSTDTALRQRIQDAIDYAQSVSRVTAPLSEKHIYVLPKTLERTPTHKIKFIFERERLHLARRI
jgi:long-chain acyl-CoA synthetase